MSRFSNFYDVVSAGPIATVMMQEYEGSML